MFDTENERFELRNRREELQIQQSTTFIYFLTKIIENDPPCNYNEEKFSLRTQKKSRSKNKKVAVKKNARS